jgi:hypothetical protein
MENVIKADRVVMAEAKEINKKSRAHISLLESGDRTTTDRIINDMAVALDCSISDGLLDQRIQDLITCLQAMARFEKSNRLR